MQPALYQPSHFALHFITLDNPRLAYNLQLLCGSEAVCKAGNCSHAKVKAAWGCIVDDQSHIAMLWSIVLGAADAQETSLCLTQHQCVSCAESDVVPDIMLRVQFMNAGCETEQ